MISLGCRLNPSLISLGYFLSPSLTSLAYYLNLSLTSLAYPLNLSLTSLAYHLNLSLTPSQHFLGLSLTSAHHHSLILESEAYNSNTLDLRTGYPEALPCFLNSPVDHRTTPQIRAHSPPSTSFSFDCLESSHHLTHTVSHVDSVVK